MGAAVPLGAEALDALMPMHLALDAGGRVASAGRTLARALSGPPEGRSVFDLLAFRRPAGIEGMEGLRAATGRTLHVAVRGGDDRLVGHAVAARDGALVLNLSFGSGLVDAVRRLSLTAGDFAPTDLAIEMLFLVEANAAALSEALALNSRLEGARIAAVEQAFTDTLTGLKNRRALDHVLARLTAEGRHFAVLNVDLDRFKAVNDTMGHAAGDQVLRAAGREMLAAVRSGDVVARVGGDEFVIVLAGLDREERLGRIASDLILGLERPVPVAGGEARISGSIGIALSGEHPEGATAAVLEAADAALYVSKAAGRGRWTLASRMRPTRPERAANGEGGPPDRRRS